MPVSKPLDRERTVHPVALVTARATSLRMDPERLRRVVKKGPAGSSAFLSPAGHTV